MVLLSVFDSTSYSVRCGLGHLDDRTQAWTNGFLHLVTLTFASSTHLNFHMQIHFGAIMLSLGGYTLELSSQLRKYSPEFKIYFYSRSSGAIFTRAIFIYIYLQRLWHGIFIASNFMVCYYTPLLHVDIIYRLLIPALMSVLYSHLIWES